MIQLPRLSRDHPAPGHGIVHLGLGAFFRSHGALVIEDAIEQAGGDWGITGVSLRSPDIRDRLSPQQSVYSAVELAAAGETVRKVGVVRDVIHAPSNPDAVIGLMADPTTRIVSLTVTEKGYCHVPSTGELDETHDDITHDLNAQRPRSAVGFILRALERRHRNGLRPFTVMSCDNLPDNGKVVRNVVLRLASLVDESLALWIADHGCFPSTMVDRIVPATTEADVTQLAQNTGVWDAAPVFHEPFLQWIIEEDFVGNERPLFEQVAGVQVVADVRPFEVMKLRMLNGTHSSLAYLGYLAGFETIAETVADKNFCKFVGRLWEREIIPTLTPPSGVDLKRYASDLLTRYQNPAIRHKTWQIAMDGSQKLPQRILGTLLDNASADRRSDGLCLSIAGWMRYVGGVDELGRAIDVRDPLAGQLRKLSENAGTPREKAMALVSVKEVFGNVSDHHMAIYIVSAYEELVKNGAVLCVEKWSDME